jgi:folate-binding protein YgfZ
MDSLTLHAEHARLGARFGAVAGREVVLHYGPEAAAPEGEQAALRQGAALVDLSARQVLRVTGADRLSFLHGMVTNDVTGMPEHGVRYAAVLTAKGAMVADLRLVRRDDDVLLLVEPGYAASVLAHLERFLISEDAAVTDVSAAFGQLALLGPRAWAVARRVLGVPGEEAPTTHFLLGGLERHGVFVLPSGLLLPGVDLLVPTEGLDAVFIALLDAGGEELRTAGWEALEVVRVESGVPRYGADMDERTIPLEANLQRALHFQKGCYVGQEVIARATFRGQMSRKLVGLLLGASHPAARTELFHGERKVGWVTSVVRSPRFGQYLALGYVHRDMLQAGTVLRLAGDNSQATVHALPFG